MVLKTKSNTNLFIIFSIVLVVLIVLSMWALGVFHGQIEPGECVAHTNYICENAVYNHTTAEVILDVGQNTGTNWTTANIFFVPLNAPRNSSGIPDLSFTPSFYPTNTLQYGLTSSHVVTLYIPLNRMPNSLMEINGTIWAQYTTFNKTTPQYVEIGVAYLRDVK